MYLTDNENTIQPTLQAVRIGHFAMILCTSGSKPVWFHNNIKIPNGVLNSKLVFLSPWNILLSDVTKKDKGVYECEGVKGANKFLAQSLLIVIGKRNQRYYLQEEI